MTNPKNETNAIPGDDAPAREVHRQPVAAGPDVVQPTSFRIDDPGRLLVAEAFDYGARPPTRC